MNTFEASFVPAEKTPEEIDAINASRKAEEEKAARGAEHLVYEVPDSERSRLDKFFGRKTTRPVSALDKLHEEALKEERKREREKAEKTHREEEEKQRARQKEEMTQERERIKEDFQKKFQEEVTLIAQSHWDPHQSFFMRYRPVDPFRPTYAEQLAKKMLDDLNTLEIARRSAENLNTGSGNQQERTASANQPINADFKTLDLSRDASNEDIKIAYRRLANKFHPDKNLGKSQDEIDTAADKFDKVHKAYERIKKERGM